MAEEKKKITKDMTLSEILDLNPQASAILMSKGMHCLGCIVAHGETLEQAVEVHGIDLEELLKELNEA